MKKKVMLLLYLLGFFFAAQAQKGEPGEYNGKVEYAGSLQQGSITVIATGFGKKTTTSQQDAEAAAFYSLMFRGIPGSQYDLPMISDESGKKDNEFVVKILKGGYKSFMTESILQSTDEKKTKQDGKKGNYSAYRITINCTALRKYLEDNGVIRKFGI